ncbi:MAG: peptidyl-prolyl cis-trans isomerase [Candidatus Omnitrophota bacterium]
MNCFVKKLLIVIFLGITANFLSGCDFFSAPKKLTNTPSTEGATPTATAPASVTAPSTNVGNQEGPIPPNVIARVGSWKLTVDEFNQRLKLLKQGLPDFNDKDPQTKASVLDELIRQQLLVKDAESSDIGDKKDIKDAVEDFRRTLLVQELASKLTKGITANEADAQKYYDQNKNLFMEPVKWKVRQIAVPDEAAAKNILVQVLQGGDFAALAQAQSNDSFAANGGIIPEFTKAPFEAMQKAISSLDAGSTSSVFKGPDGYYIAHVDEKKGGVIKPFADVKTELISGLTLRKQQTTILEYIEKLAQKTKVDVNKELLGLSENKQP